MDPGTLGIGHDTAQDTTQIPYRVAVRVGLVALFCAWICLMGFLQHGFAGVVAPSLLTVGVLVCIQVWIDKRYGLGELATVAVRVIGLSMIIGGWLYMVGSYSWSRDLSVLVICCIGAFLMVYRGPERIDRWNRIGGKLRLRWRDPAFALVTNRARRKFRLYTSTWLLTSWIASSILNLATGWNPVLPAPVSRTHVVKNEWRELKVAIALSGGGYRAALMHAGVLDALEHLQVPITHVSCVSGGSILGSFYAAGGKPRDFLKAVEEHRFNLRRELADIHNAMRLVTMPGRIPVLDVEVFPVGTFSRTDVQANMIRRVLIGDARLSDLPPSAPQLMICATDLRRAVAIGFVRHGVWVSSLPSVRGCELPRGRTPAKFLRTTATQFPATEPMARLVAASGAFPGAFNSVVVDIPMGSASGSEVESLQLADGGVFDNSGLGLLLGAHRGYQRLRGGPATEMNKDALNLILQRPVGPQREQAGEPLPDPAWKLDFVLVSDGGECLEAAKALKSLDDVSRAIDVLYACAGLRFLMVEAYQRRDRPPVVVLGSSPFSTNPVGWIRTVVNEVAEAVKKLQENGTIQDAVSSVQQRWVAVANAAPKELANRDPLGEMVALAIAQVPQETLTLAKQWRASGVLPGSAPAAAQQPTDEAWMADDLRECLMAFRETTTLQDQIPPSKAQALHRLGQYLVLLNWSDIHGGLERATHR